jgi:hypothetical protein
MIEPGRYTLEEAAALGVYDALSGRVLPQEGLIIFKACSGGCGCRSEGQECWVFIRVRS